MAHEFFSASGLKSSDSISVAEEIIRFGTSKNEHQKMSYHYHQIYYASKIIIHQISSIQFHDPSSQSPFFLF